MKLRLPIPLLMAVLTAALSLPSSARAEDETLDLRDITTFSLSLEKDTSYVNSHFMGNQIVDTTISFDGGGTHKLSFVKNTQDSKDPIFGFGKTGAGEVDMSVSFRNLRGLSFINENTGNPSFGAAVWVEHIYGSSSIEFAQINGDLLLSGFRTATTPGAIIARCNRGTAAVRFSDITGNILINDNQGNDWGVANFGAAISAFSDDSPAATSIIDFTRVNGDITFSRNIYGGYGGALLSFAYGGIASLNFSDINGNLSFTDNSAYYGGVICLQSKVAENGIDCVLNFSQINGNIVFARNESKSGSGIVVFGSKSSIVFSDITGNIVFENNKATGAGKEVAQGAGIILTYNNTKEQAGEGWLEFSRITGDVSFLNNTANGMAGGVGGAIVIGDQGQGTGHLAHLLLSADYGNITFFGNTAGYTANAVYLEGDTDIALRASSGHAVSFYDPIFTPEKFTSSLHINQSDRSSVYNGTVLFSGEKITAELLGGEADSLDDRLAASKKTIVRGETILHGGTLSLKNEAVLQSKTATLNSGTLSTKNEGLLSLTGGENSPATLTILSGANLNGNVTFSGANSRLNLKSGEGASSLKGRLTGLNQISMDGGTFTRTEGFQQLDSLTLSSGTLNLGASSMDTLTYDGGTLNLVLGGASLQNGKATLLDLGSISGNLAAGLTGGTGSALSAGVRFDLDSYGIDLVGGVFDLVTLGGEQQQYSSLLIDGITCTANSGWQTYDKDGLTFQYLFNGSSVQIGDTVKDIVVSGGLPSAGQDGGYNEIVKTTIKGDVAVSEDDPSTINFISKEGKATAIGNNISLNGSISAAQSSLTGVTSTINEDGTQTEASRELLGDNQITLILQDNVSAAPIDGANSGSIQVDSTLVRNGTTVNLDSTALNVSTQITVNKDSAITANGESGQINIGGGQLEDAAKNSPLAAALCTSQISESTLNLTNGAGVTLSRVTTKDGTGIDTKLVISDSSISLGSSGDPSGGFLKATGGSRIELYHSTIQGNGTLQGLTMDGGRVTAGHSPGIMTLGDISLTGGAALQTWITADLASGVLNTDAANVISQFSVTGNVSLDNASFSVAWDPAAIGNDDQLTSGTSFLFFDVKEGGSLNGQFSSLNLPELNPGLVWDTSQLYSEGILSIINARLGDGERIASALWSSARSVSGFARTATEHLNDFHANGQSANIWVSGLGDFLSMGNHNGRTGFDYQGGGYAVGADYKVQQGSTLGLAFGQTFGTHKPSRGTELYAPGKIDQDSLMMALYGRQNLCSCTDGSWYLDGYFSYGRVDNKSDKTALYDGSSATGKWRDDVYAAGLKSVWEARLDNRSILRPFVGIDYIHAGQDRFTESGSSASCLYDNGSYQNWSATAGVSIDRTYETAGGVLFVPRLTVAYVGDFARNNPSVEYTDMNSGRQKAEAVTPGRSAFQGAFDLGVRLNKHWGLGAGYEVEARSGSTAQTVNASANYSF